MRNSEGVQVNPWPSGSTSWRKRCWTCKDRKAKCRGHWHLFEKSNLTPERQERVVGAAEGVNEWLAAVRGAFFKFFPDNYQSVGTTSSPLLLLSATCLFLKFVSCLSGGETHWLHVWGTLHSETECSEQTVREPRVWKACSSLGSSPSVGTACGRRALPRNGEA